MFFYPIIIVMHIYRSNNIAEWIGCGSTERRVYCVRIACTWSMGVRQFCEVVPTLWESTSYDLLCDGSLHRKGTEGSSQRVSQIVRSLFAFMFLSLLIEIFVLKRTGTHLFVVKSSGCFFLKLAYIAVMFRTSFRIFHYLFAFLKLV